MLGLTLWSINLFHMGYDVLGAIVFVLSMGFKQMALYYAPAIFGYLFGKCLYLRDSRG
jgi:alpha-1,3-glucosyltransferase